MDNTLKSLSRLLLLIIIVCGLSFQISYVSGVLTPSVPEFTVKFADNSYDVPQKTETSKNSYTNETTTTTIPGYHVENKTIEVTIKNNLGASFYNFRFKGHYEDEWCCYPHDPDSFGGYNYYDAFSVPYQASNSSYTVATLPFSLFQDVPIGGEVDFQVQALFGNYRAAPYGHPFPLPAPTYDFYFEGTVSDWSNTQTVTFKENDVPEFPAWTILPLVLSITLFSMVVKRKLTSS